MIIYSRKYFKALIIYAKNNIDKQNFNIDLLKTYIELSVKVMFFGDPLNECYALEYEKALDEMDEIWYDLAKQYSFGYEFIVKERFSKILSKYFVFNFKKPITTFTYSIK